MRFLAFTIALLLFGPSQGCQILTDADLSQVRCKQEGFIGGPACPDNEFCQNGVCVGCSAVEICGDGIDNDCTGQADDGCAEAGPPVDAGDSGEAGSNLDDRVKDNLVLLYTFLDGAGNTVRDGSGVNPLDLTIGEENNVTWLSGGGLRIDIPTLISSANPADKVISACQQSNTLTVEAWLEPDGLGQLGPAQIASLSFDNDNRNFSLAQEKSELDFRLRTTTTSPNGEPSVRSGGATLPEGLSHVVYVRNSGGFARFVINGVEAGTGEAAGNLSNWDSSYRFALGNELTGDRPWRGTLYLVAVYARALTPTEIATNYAVGVPR